MDVTLSGNEITDTIRLAAVEGDGRDPESSVGIWEGTTNLILNSSFENDDLGVYLGWGDYGGSSTLVRTQAEAKFGEYSLSVDTNGAASDEGVTTVLMPCEGSTEYSCSVWVKAPNGATLQMAFVGYTSDPFAFNEVIETTPFTGTGDWERITCTGTTDADTDLYLFTLATSFTTQNIVFYVDGAQFEQQPLATPFVEVPNFTNLCLNPEFTVDTSMWSAKGGASISRDTGFYFESPASLKVDTTAAAFDGAQGGGSGTGNSITVSPETAYVAQILCWVPTGITLYLNIAEYLADGTTFQGESFRTVSGNDNWNNLVHFFTTGGSTERIRIQPIQEEATAETFWVDSVRLRRLGSRGTSRVQAPVAGFLDETQGWVAARFRINWATEPQTDPGLFTWADTVNDRLELALEDVSGGRVAVVRGAGGSQTNTGVLNAFSVGKIITAIFAWTATEIKVSSDGSAFASTGNTLIPTLAATSFDIGSRTPWVASREADCDFFWFATGSGTLTDADAATIADLQDGEVKEADFPVAITGLWPELAADLGYQRIFGPELLGTSAADLYTVPAGILTRVRHIYVNNPSGSPVDFTLSIGNDAAATRLYDSFNVPAGGSLEWAYDHALAAGEKIQGYAGTGSTLVLNIDAYLEAV